MKTLLKKAREVLAKEKNLVIGDEKKLLVFVGDVHGDIDAVRVVLEKYWGLDCQIIFLGDLVDRGKDSIGVIELLLRKKIEKPEKIVLLMGNHEAFPIIPCNQNTFWQEVEEKGMYNDVVKTFLELPLVFVSKHIIALHGGIPDIDDIGEINEIEKKENDGGFQILTWADFVWEGIGERRCLDKKYFERKMRVLGKKLLIRGHQADVKGYLFEKRCLTLLTSELYEEKGKIKGRIVAEVRWPEVKIVDIL